MFVDEARLREFMIRQDGPKAAAYLVKVNKSLFHTFGAVDFRIREGEHSPTWFTYAMETFNQRSTRWQVDYREEGNDRYWRVSWKAWLANGHPN